MMNPLSAPYHYYMDTMAQPLPEEGKLGAVIKKIILAVAGIVLVPLFGIMKLFGDLLPSNALVVVIPSSANSFTVDIDGEKTSLTRRGHHVIEDFD